MFLRLVPRFQMSNDGVSACAVTGKSTAMETATTVVTHATLSSL